MLPHWPSPPEYLQQRSLMARTNKGALQPVEEVFDGSNGGPSLMDEVEKLKELGEVNLLEEARRAAIRLLLAKLNTGGISASELAVLRNLLRDNGMVMGLDQPEDEKADDAQRIGFHLPDLSDPDDDDYD